jgi:glutaredoxin 3
MGLEMSYVVYGTSNCSYCDKAKALLEQKGKTFSFVNIEEDEAGFEVFVKMGYRTVPQILDDQGNFVGGFDKLVQSFKE